MTEDRDLDLTDEVTSGETTPFGGKADPIEQQPVKNPMDSFVCLQETTSFEAAADRGQNRERGVSKL